MRTFKELCSGKPSKALRAMVDGLLDAEKREDFKVNFGTFGALENGVCFGCAATCAVQMLSGVSLDGSVIFERSIRAKALDVVYDDLICFEHAIDRAREGYLYQLFDYMGVDDEWMDEYNDRFYLYTNDWKGQIPEVEKLIIELESKNL